jgi:hypothetical protein
MAARPGSWWPRGGGGGGDADGAEREKKRRAAIWRRHARMNRLRRLYRRARSNGLIMLLAFALLFAFAAIASRPGFQARDLVWFPNCAAARAAGVAPIRIGQPGYRPELDADSDGIACEPLPANTPWRR